MQLPKRREQKTSVVVYTEQQDPGEKNQIKTCEKAWALAMIWLLVVGVGIHQNWPAQHLPHEAPPKLPRFEDCPTDFDRCFASKLRARVNMATDRETFSDGYSGRVSNHLLIGTGVFLIPFVLSQLWRGRRAIATKTIKLFV
ncbi:hypothetical protein NPS53_08855 [Pseudomonas putida]|uniref:hypothetical protein n=1 Tax=Pseudomonas putida TaxID=303 RepID=UPI002363B31D|nr:hypothetical protein [Pseudomonas putida]MDD2139683.1 hypothetical protein [Pseudomonas putida]HDS1721607.1 hypothetical protein [Pseudomonas putida]